MILGSQACKCIEKKIAFLTFCYTIKLNPQKYYKNLVI